MDNHKILVLLLFLFACSISNAQGWKDYEKQTIEKEGITLVIAIPSGSVTQTENGFNYTCPGGGSMLFQAIKNGRKVKVEFESEGCKLYKRGFRRNGFSVPDTPDCKEFTISVKNQSAPTGKTTFHITLDR